MVVAAILGVLVSAPVWLVAISWLQTVLIWRITISEKKGKLPIFPAFLFCLMDHIIRSALSYQKRGIYVMHFHKFPLSYNPGSQRHRQRVHRLPHIVSLSFHIYVQYESSLCQFRYVLLRELPAPLGNFFLL